MKELLMLGGIVAGGVYMLVTFGHVVGVNLSHALTMFIR